MAPLGHIQYLGNSFLTIPVETHSQERQRVLDEVMENGWALEDASDALKNDREIVLAAVVENGAALQFASDALKNDREIVLAALPQHGLVLEYASHALKNDREIVLAAVMQDGRALGYASEELKNNREIVVAAVAQNGNALQYASDALQNDRGIVLAAVARHGGMLEYASDELKNDREIVLAAVANDGWALQYASDALKNDREIVLAAMARDGNALRFASTELRAEFQSPQFSSIFAELHARNRFKAAVTNQDLKNFELEIFPVSLQPAITAWVVRLTDTIMFENARSASILANQVYAIFAYAKESPEFFGKLEEELQNAQMSCSDSSLVIYHTLSTAKKLMQVFTKALPEIIQLCRGLYKLSLLETQAFKQFQEFGGDQISISLGLQARLCDELSLPLDFNEVRFDHNCLGLTEEAVTAAREFVIQSLNNPEGFVQYFSQLEPWQKHLLATNEAVKAKHTEITDQFAERLEELMDRAGTMTDIEYKTQIDAMVIERTLAFKKLFEDTTLHILETTTPSQAASSSGAASSSL